MCLIIHPEPWLFKYEPKPTSCNSLCSTIVNIEKKKSSLRPKKWTSKKLVIRVWCEQFSSCSQSYRSILVHVLVLGFLQGSHSGSGSGSCSGSSCSNRGCCSSSSRLGEIWGWTGVWWDAYPTRSSIRPSRVTLTRSTIKSITAEYSKRHKSMQLKVLLVHLLATKASSSRVIGSSVHTLLHVALVWVAFAGELLLWTWELRRVQPWIATRHTRAQRITPRVHRIVAVDHRVPQDLSDKTQVNLG